MDCRHRSSLTPALTLERLVADRIRESIAVKQLFLQSSDSLAIVTEAAVVIIESLRKGGKVFFFGNGGAAPRMLSIWRRNLPADTFTKGRVSPGSP